ncbi:MAG: ABC transporter permease [Lachnospiraceae bacterium]|nr:ABC transporter permease [Lachnospiraceae bacterium]
MDLFWVEHKKLWSKKSVKFSVLLCFAYIVIFGGILIFQWMTFGSQKDGSGLINHNFDGYEYIRKHKEFATRYGNTLTDESLSTMIMDHQRALENGDDEVKLMDWPILTTWTNILWPEEKDATSIHLIIDYIDVDAIENMYDRRQKAVENFMEMSGFAGREKEFLLAMNDKVDTPFKYSWLEGWSTVLIDEIPDFGMILAIVIVIALSSLFAGEWHERTGPMLLSMKMGWEKDSLAKIAVGFCFSIELFLIVIIPHIFVQLVFLGVEGWDVPIQCIKMIAIAPLNMLQAEIYEYSYVFIGIIGFSAMVMLVSSLFKNDRFAMIGGFALLVVPAIISDYLPYRSQLVVSLFPLAGNAADIFRMYTLNLFGKIVWLPYMELVVPLVFAIISIPLIVKRWSRMQKN